TRTPDRLDGADRATLVRRVDDVHVRIRRDDVAGDRHRLLGEPGILLPDDADVGRLDLVDEAANPLRGNFGKGSLEREDGDLGLAAKLVGNELLGGDAAR